MRRVNGSVDRAQKPIHRAGEGRRGGEGMEPPAPPAPHTAPTIGTARRKEGHAAPTVTIVTQCAVRTFRPGILRGMPGTL